MADHFDDFAPCGHEYFYFYGSDPPVYAGQVRDVYDRLLAFRTGQGEGANMEYASAVGLFFTLAGFPLVFITRWLSNKVEDIEY